MPTWAAILIGFVGSAGLWGFLQFMIKRFDAKKGVLAEVRGLRADFEESKALDARRRILQFADMLIHEDKEARHSKELFDLVMDDITEYEKYCDAHKGFKNNKAGASIAHISKVYAERLDKKDFL